MIGWHHQFNGHELGQTLGDSEGQGSLVCWSTWGRKGLDTTERLNNNLREMKVCNDTVSASIFTTYLVLILLTHTVLRLIVLIS